MPSKKKTSLAKTAAADSGLDSSLVADLRSLIASTRQSVAWGVNAALVMLYWRVGDRIRRNVLKEKRAEYGAEILPTVSAKLVPEFGQGFGPRNLARMIAFSEALPDEETVSSLSSHLSWSHFVELLPLEKPSQRDFYAELCRIERWSVRELRQKIGGMLYERTAISKKPDQLIKKELEVVREQDRLTPDLIFRDPYFLDFLGLKGSFSEKDLEAAILHDIESFLVELGSRGIRVAEYLTALPPKKLLEEKLHHAVQLARKRIETHESGDPANPSLQNLKSPIPSISDLQSPDP